MKREELHNVVRNAIRKHTGCQRECMACIYAASEVCNFVARHRPIERERLLRRALNWTESDLRKFPTATLELIDQMREMLAVAMPVEEDATQVKA